MGTLGPPGFEQSRQGVVTKASVNLRIFANNAFFLLHLFGPTLGLSDFRTLQRVNPLTDWRGCQPQPAAPIFEYVYIDFYQWHKRSIIILLFSSLYWDLNLADFNFGVTGPFANNRSPPKFELLQYIGFNVRVS